MRDVHPWAKVHLMLCVFQCTDWLFGPGSPWRIPCLLIFCLKHKTTPIPNVHLGKWIPCAFQSSDENVLQVMYICQQRNTRPWQKWKLILTVIESADKCSEMYILIWVNVKENEQQLSNPFIVCCTHTLFLWWMYCCYMLMFLLYECVYMCNVLCTMYSVLSAISYQLSAVT